MSKFNATFDVPEYIDKGLFTGFYERVGGVVRETRSKQVVAWLRESFKEGDPAASSKILAPSPVNALSSTLNLALSSVSVVSGILNLAVSATGFIIVNDRLDIIEQQLKDAQEVFGNFIYKIDLTFYANFRAACKTANMGIRSPVGSKLRESYFLDATSKFSLAIEHYEKLTQMEINRHSLVASEYLSTLCLAYVTQVRCLLELEDLKNARDLLRNGAAVLRPLFETHVTTLLTSNPAAYLHPSLKGKVDLRSLTKVYQWLTPDVDEIAVFEMQRENLFNLAQKPEEWSKSVPQAIYIPKGDGSAKQPNVLRKALSGITSLVKKTDSQEAVPQSPELAIIDLLPATMELMMSMVEDDNRLTMYESELKAMQDSEESFQQWQQLTPPSTADENEKNYFYITLSEKG